MFFDKGQIIDGRYRVVFPLIQDGVTETYRVRDELRGLLFLTLYRHDIIPDDAVDDNGELKVIAIRRSLSNPNVCAYVDSGSFVLDELRFSYMVTRFVSCETLTDYIMHGHKVSVADARQIVMTLLRLLRQLHALPKPIAHGHISKDNVLIDLTGRLSDLKLTGFGLQCRSATEDDIKEDILAAAKMLYNLCFGIEVQQPPRMPNVLPDNMDQRLIAVMVKSLSGNGFASADEMIKAMSGTSVIDCTREMDSMMGINDNDKTAQKKNGFNDVAGMTELKALLNESVLYVLRDQERAKRYNLEIPNGMLLYGPPGCGKTFIAERFAEEAGYNYRFVKSSDLASTYIHGTQEKIGQLFDEARAKAPTVLCFDEFEALASKRMEHHNANLSGEVNELLSQLNNCGHDRVFVIATTNQPDLIDPAILRRGRIDHIIYVPMPDFDAREGLFRIHLANRPCNDNIDYYRLAALTKDYIASEIAFVCNQSALEASHTNSDISQELLEMILHKTQPRTTEETKQYYEKMKNRMDNIREERRRIGF